MENLFVKSNEIYLLKLSNIYSRIVSLDQNLISSITRDFSFFVENYYFAPKYKLGIWDGKIKFIHKDGMFATGLLQEIIKYIKNYEKISGVKYNILIENSLSDKSDISDFDKISNNLKVFLNNQEQNIRDYQINGAKELLQNKRGILLHATASGKSFTLALVINYLVKKGIKNNIIILVPTTSLVEQLYSDFVNYGIDESLLGKFYQGEKNINTITISTWQSMINRKGLLKKFDAFIFDECHFLKAKVIKAISDNIINADYRIGVTGTLPDDKSLLYTIFGITGNILHEVHTDELIKKELISDIKICIPFLKYKDYNKSKYGDYYLEKNFLEQNLNRNIFINNIVKKYLKMNKNIMLLVNKIQHGDILKKTLETYIDKKEYNNIFYVTGNTKAVERERIRKLVNETDKNVIIATTVFTTGINIPKLHVLIFADAGKAKIRTLQSIGRGLRRCEFKKVLKLYDVADDCKYSKKHLCQRLQYYSENKFNFKIKKFEL